MKKLAPIFALAVASLLLVRCGRTNDDDADAGNLADAAALSDAGSDFDAGDGTDAGDDLDASVDSDAGGALDAAVNADAGVDSDASVDLDGSVGYDASVGDDAGVGYDGSIGYDAGADSDAGSGESTFDPCSFNSDCIPSERCECDESTGCLCVIGARGTGVNGVDQCNDGNDCESAVCLEGPGDVLYCSGPCVTADDCGPQLPICADIAFVGRICIRDPGSA
ncbi:MAG: hypothetical protein ACOX6T_25090 [Myxococcales bacterium]|jgi:hypothetical protein